MVTNPTPFPPGSLRGYCGEREVTMIYETGKIGLTGPEIEAEMREHEEIVFARDEEAKANRIAYSYLCTPQEIHRLQVLRAMQMANSCLCYDPFGRGWTNHTDCFRRPPRVVNTDPKYKCSAEQENAFILSEKELDNIFAAQQRRIREEATIVDTGITDEDGFRYRGFKWKK